MSATRTKFIISLATVDACSKDEPSNPSGGPAQYSHEIRSRNPEDVAAQIFIANHGGVAAIKSEKELVTQLAQDMHLTADDEVMDQFHTNLTQLVEVPHAQLERTLNEIISTAVIDGIKGLAAQMNEAEKQVFTCV
jgi:hypothetical protein